MAQQAVHLRVGAEGRISAFGVLRGDLQASRGIGSAFCAVPLSVPRLSAVLSAGGRTASTASKAGRQCSAGGIGCTQLPQALTRDGLFHLLFSLFQYFLQFKVSVLFLKNVFCQKDSGSWHKASTARRSGTEQLAGVAGQGLLSDTTSHR